MIEVRSGLESDAVLMAEIHAASGKDALSRVATEFPFPLLRISREGHVLYANALGADLARRAKIKLGDLMPKNWRPLLTRAVTEKNPVQADWSFDDKQYALQFVNVPDSFYVTVFVNEVPYDQAQTTRDPLTGLANKNLFLDRLGKAVSLSRRNERMVAVHVIKLQHFKEFSQTLGDGTRDIYLCKLAERLRSIVRMSDTVARIGHDEFALLQMEPQNLDGVETTTVKMKAALDMPIVIAGESLQCRSHIGISTFPSDGETAEEIIRNAFLALDADVPVNDPGYRFFVAPMRETVDRFDVVEDDLERAVAEKEFVLYFQPKQELETGRLSGMEALVRWNHPKYGEIMPDEFIPAAESSRLILPLGEWVLRNACLKTKDLLDKGIGPLKVAVNLSALQFADSEIVEVISDILSETGLPADSLELEITESVAMSDAVAASRTFKRLADLGVYTSIDDFGTGYSSLAYLKNFDVQRIKIDKLFVDDIGSDSGAGSIARAITTMGHSLDLDVTAEGVTTEQQMAFLRRLECDEIQGSFFSEPLGMEAFEAFAMAYRPPQRYQQGVLNWSDFRDLGNSLQGTSSYTRRRRMKDERKNQL